MPVCIVGMHRSGTSMVARALNLCGLYLGEPEDFYRHDNPLMPTQPEDNPEGHWEHLGFLTCNLDILRTLTGSIIDRPPFDFPPGWPDDPRLLPVQEKAQQLIQTMMPHGLWGWKDPRNTLTLPFWQRLLPDLKVVVCLRNPLEVAQSLMKRDFRDEPSGLAFWLAFHEQLAPALPGTPFIVTHMDTYFYDAAAEISRVAAFAGLEVTDDMAHLAAQSIKAEHHRNLSADFLLERDDIPPGLRDCYLALRQQAGTVYQKMMDDMAYQMVALRNIAASLHERHRAASTRARELQHFEYLLGEERRKTALYEQELVFLHAEYARMLRYDRVWRAMESLRAIYHRLVPLHTRLALRDLRIRILRQKKA